MSIIITSLIVTIAICAFILIAVLFGTISAIVISAAACAAIFVFMMGAILGLVALWLEHIDRKRFDRRMMEQQHG